MLFGSFVQVGLLVALLDDISEHGGFPRAAVERAIPPFILDTCTSVLQ